MEEQDLHMNSVAGNSNYIDGYVFPISKEGVKTYQKIAQEIAVIWKEHGALGYYEYLSEDFKLDGTRSFHNCLSADEQEHIVFGWMMFSSKETRDEAHKKVANDPRMEALVAPLTAGEKVIFDAAKMVYGRFERLISD